MTLDKIIALIVKFENAVQNAWIYDTKLEFDESYSPDKLNKADKLFEEYKFLREQLLVAVEQQNKELQHFRQQVSDASWIRNPDRMGGQFTQDEIDESSRGGHGW